MEATRRTRKAISTPAARVYIIEEVPDEAVSLLAESIVTAIEGGAVVQVFCLHGSNGVLAIDERREKEKFHLTDRS